MKIGEFRYLTETISTEDALININFHVSGDIAVDPFISDIVCSDIDLLIITFDRRDEGEVAQAIDIFNLLHKNEAVFDSWKEPHRIVLNPTFGAECIENIMITNSEMPIVEKIAPALLLGLSESVLKEKSKQKTNTKLDEQTVKSDKKIEKLLEKEINKKGSYIKLEYSQDNEQGHIVDVCKIYSWILNHYFETKNIALSETQRNNLKSAIQECANPKKTSGGLFDCRLI